MGPTRCLEFLHHPDADVRAAAAHGLGHLAWIHRQLDVDLVAPLLETMKSDLAVGGAPEDALDDICQFMGNE